MNTYFIVSGRSLSEITEIVNFRLKEGCTCLGGITFANYFYQAMLRPN